MAAVDTASAIETATAPSRRDPMVMIYPPVSGLTTVPQPGARVKAVAGSTAVSTRRRESCGLSSGASGSSGGVWRHKSRAWCTGTALLSTGVSPTPPPYAPLPMGPPGRVCSVAGWNGWSDSDSRRTARHRKIGNGAMTRRAAEPTARALMDTLMTVTRRGLDHQVRPHSGTAERLRAFRRPGGPAGRLAVAVEASALI